MDYIKLDSLNENLTQAVAEIIIATEEPHSERQCQLTANSLIFGIYQAILQTCRTEGVTGTDAIRTADDVIKTICCHDYM